MNTITRVLARLFISFLCLSWATAASAFYNPSTGRWLSRDPSGEGEGGLGLYVFAGNSGVNVADYLGLWTTGSHHTIIDLWLNNNPIANKNYNDFKWHCVHINVRAMLKSGNDIVDGVAGIAEFCDAQSTANAYKHGMRPYYQSDPSIAEAQCDAFYRSMLMAALAERDQALAQVDAGDLLGAAFSLAAAIQDIGQAQHPIADMTSPSHSGFQRWWGLFEGPAVLTPPGYAVFLSVHHAHESSTVFNSQQDSVSSTVADTVHPELLRVLSE